MKLKRAVNGIKYMFAGTITWAAAIVFFWTMFTYGMMVQQGLAKSLIEMDSEMFYFILGAAVIIGAVFQFIGCIKAIPVSRYFLYALIIGTVGPIAVEYTLRLSIADNEAQAAYRLFETFLYFVPLTTQALLFLGTDKLLRQLGDEKQKEAGKKTKWQFITICIVSFGLALFALMGWHVGFFGMIISTVCLLIYMIRAMRLAKKKDLPVVDEPYSGE